MGFRYSSISYFVSVCKATLNSKAPPAETMFHGLPLVLGDKLKHSGIGSHLNLLMSVCFHKSFAGTICQQKMTTFILHFYLKHNSVHYNMNRTNANASIAHSFTSDYLIQAYNVVAREPRLSFKNPNLSNVSSTNISRDKYRQFVKVK